MEYKTRPLKLTDTENRLVFARGGGEEEWAKWVKAVKKKKTLFFRKIFFHRKKELIFFESLLYVISFSSYNGFVN